MATVVTSLSRKEVPAPTRNQERTENTIERLRQTAFQLIAEGGVTALTIAALAKRSGYSTAIVSYHFGSKANFIRYLLNDLFEQGRGVFTEPLRGVDPVEEIRQVFENVVHFTREHPGVVSAYHALLTSANDFNPVLLKILRKHNRRARKTIADALIAGQQAGSVKSNIDAGAMATAILGATRGITSQAMVDPEVDLDAAFAAVAEGLAPALNTRLIRGEKA